MDKMNTMQAEVFSLPDLIRTQVPIIDERIHAAFIAEDYRSLQQIILTGCGDSYYAGLGTRFFFNKLCGLPTFGVNAMDAGRYLLFDADTQLAQNSLVMATSVSGRVTRTVEAMRLAKGVSALTVAITGHPEAPLAQAASRIIDCTIPSLPNPENDIIPGVRSYRMTLIVHFLLAIHFAQSTDRISTPDADTLRAQLLSTADAIEKTLQTENDKVKQLVDHLANQDYFLFVGDGPHRASAEFSAAKVIEATGLIAYGQDTEEWAHIQHYENARPAMPTFFFCSGHRSHDRLIHLTPHVKNVGRTLIGIFSASCAPDHTSFDHTLTIQGATPEFFTPMVYPVLTELFSAYLADKLGVRFFREDFSNYKNSDIERIRGENTISLKKLKELSGQ